MAWIPKRGFVFALTMFCNYNGRPNSVAQNVTGCLREAADVNRNALLTYAANNYCLPARAKPWSCFSSDCYTSSD